MDRTAPRRWAVLSVAAIAVAGLIGGSLPIWAESDEGTILGSAKDSVPGSFVVTLKSGGLHIQSIQSRDQLKAAVSASASTLSSRYGGTVTDRYSSAIQGYSVVGLSEAKARELAADPAVQSVERNVRMRVSDVQNPAQWDLDRLDTHPYNRDNTYVYPNTASSVTAYVMDTGIRQTHGDFGGRASYGRNFVDRVKNPYNEPANANNSNDPANSNDCHGHGTHVSGTIGGANHGVAKQIKLVAVRVLDCAGAGYLDEFLNGIEWIVANAVKPAVVNASLGWDSVLPSADNAIRAAIASGLTFSVAAGNGDAAGNPLNACDSSPGSVKEALVVAAVDDSDRPGWFSNYGPCVDLYAPGVRILSDWNTGDGDEAEDTGTSMAAPHVTGAAALILQAHPQYTPDQVRQALIMSSSVNVVKMDQAPSSVGATTPNRFLYVRPADPPQMASRAVGLNNTRFGTTEVYGRSANDHIIYAYKQDEWSDWFDLGGDAAGDPAMLFNARFGTTEVYTRLKNNHLAYRYFSNGWSAWIDLGGDVAGNPAVLYNPKYGTTEVYVRTSDNKVKYRSFSSGWSDWIDLEGKVASDPALLYNPKYGTTEVYARATDNTVRYRYYLDGWSAWISLDGTVTGNPQVIYNPKYGTTEVYARTVGNTLGYRYFLGGWSTWIDLGGTLASDPGLVYNPTYGTTEAYAQNGSGALQYVYYLGGWSGWNNLGGSVSGAPSVIYNQTNRTTQVYTHTPGNHANFAYYSNGWTPWTDVSA